MYSDSLYTGMAGLQAISAQMEAVASNLSNSQTPGYESVQAVTQAQLYQGTNAPAGADAMEETLGPDLKPGPLKQTGDPLNVGVGGNAWLQVQTPGGVALTRDGSLTISSSGILTDSAGNPILSTNGTPISLPALSKLQIGTDGTISGIPVGSTSGIAKVIAQIGLVSTPSGKLSSLGGSLYQPSSGASLVPATDGSLHQGYLNDSNVDPTTAMMQLIDASRSYQMQTEMMKNQSVASQSLNNLLSQG
ncbi:flagellar hook-basal body complex protein [Acidocella aminolytica]|uniref:Flagellar basal-body rod protein FlgF n=1 Tax=Acidocella aminolytica 101 = DSM 11237 TaxID=1120923 RepID=A0A0D6PEC6_9PROT|nr:flagellar hook-basal body complex protein [Acidocella aminolytica]GAN80037.1 flagellar basal body rod protein FlgF/FlgG [Acidocella aminolytica 101 = DSM 11237]GBQ40604.1 flagellar basal body rod protein [Acidocella aminolytica 101 = DSM 11237]SHF08095.1 flagellar basal-body rod protein FlgF [Acidocella aminolytica 101 = DSM 11237]